MTREEHIEAAFASEAMRAIFDAAERFQDDHVAKIDIRPGSPCVTVHASFGMGDWMQVEVFVGSTRRTIAAGLSAAFNMPPTVGDSSESIGWGMCAIRVKPEPSDESPQT